jgi:hypothetical protein
MLAELQSIAYLYRTVTRARRNVAERREESMKQPRSSRQLIRMWHRREKATIDHLVRSIDPLKSPPATTHSAFTASGLAVEDQVRKAWRPPTAGLAMF